MFIFNLIPTTAWNQTVLQPLTCLYGTGTDATLLFSHSSFKLNTSSNRHSIQCRSSVLYSVHSAGREASLSSSRSGSLVLLSREVLITRHILVSQRKKKSLTLDNLSNTYPQYHTHWLSHTHNHPSKCHRLGRTLQRFRGPRINITSFLSISALFIPLKLLYICEWSYLYSWQVSIWVKGLEARVRQSEIKMKRV